MLIAGHDMAVEKKKRQRNQNLANTQSARMKLQHNSLENYATFISLLRAKKTKYKESHRAKKLWRKEKKLVRKRDSKKLKRQKKKGRTKKQLKNTNHDNESSNKFGFKPWNRLLETKLKFMFCNRTSRLEEDQEGKRLTSGNIKKKRNNWKQPVKTRAYI